MKTKNKYFPVRGWSLKGRILLCPIQFLFRIISLIQRNKWNSPREGFEENPVYFTWKDVVYLGTKYYGQPHETGKVNMRRVQLSEISSGEAQITLHAGGDLMPYEVMLNGKSDSLWSGSGEDYFCADLVMANLETPLDFTKSPSFVPELMLNDMMFNGNEALWDIFTGKGKYAYHYLSLANNHMLDAGLDSLRATMHWLDRQGISYSGARKDSKELNFTMITKNGICIGVVNYTYSLNRVIADTESSELISHLRLNSPHENLNPLFDDLKLARTKGSDVVIASLHMGNAYQCYPSGHIRNRVREIFENGQPDIILIHHPHNLQPSEVVHYQRKSDGKQARGVVYYSLGDFVAYDIFSWSHLTGYAKIEISKTTTGEIRMNTGFEFLYLHRDTGGNFQFIPWLQAIKEKDFQDEHYFFLKDWYDRHASGFFMNDI